MGMGIMSDNGNWEGSGCIHPAGYYHIFDGIRRESGKMGTAWGGHVNATANFWGRYTDPSNYHAPWWINNTEPWRAAKLQYRSPCWG